MLSDNLHKHLDSLEEIEVQLQDDIDRIIKAIDKEALINDPSATLQETVELIKNLMVEKYIPLSGRLGFDLSEIIQNKQIFIDPKKNPKANEDVINDNG